MHLHLGGGKHGVQSDTWPFISSQCCINTTYDMLLSQLDTVVIDLG